MYWLLFLLPNFIISGIPFCHSELLIETQQFSRGIWELIFLSRDFFKCCWKPFWFMIFFSAGFKSGVPPGAIRSLLHPEAWLFLLGRVFRRYLWLMIGQVIYPYPYIRKRHILRSLIITSTSAIETTGHFWTVILCIPIPDKVNRMHPYVHLATSFPL